MDKKELMEWYTMNKLQELEDSIERLRNFVGTEGVVAPAQRATNTGSLTIAAQAVIDSYNNGDYSSDFTETILGLRNALQQQ